MRVTKSRLNRFGTLNPPSFPATTGLALCCKIFTVKMSLPLECEGCGKRFGTDANLLRHLRASQQPGCKAELRKLLRSTEQFPGVEVFAGEQHHPNERESSVPRYSHKV